MRVWSAALLASLASSGPNMTAANPLAEQFQLAQQGDFISIQGGIHDGAAAGQSAFIVITPDDRVLCTFSSKPVLGGDGSEASITPHDLVVENAYADISDFLLPITPSVNGSGLANFLIHVRLNDALSFDGLSWTDPRFDPLMDYFFQTPTPCWSFG